MVRNRTSIVLFALLALFAAACGSDGDDADDSASGNTSASTAAAAEPEAPALSGEITIYGSGGSTGDGMMNEVIPPFEEATGVKVNYIGLANAEVLAQVEAQKASPIADIVHTSDSFILQGRTAGLWAELDMDLIPNAENVVDTFASTDTDRVPTYAQGFGMIYNTEIFEEKGWDPPTSFADMWDPKYKGGVAMVGCPASTCTGLALIIARENGGDVDNMQPAWDKFAELKPNLFASFAQQPQMDDAFAQGQVWLGLTPSTRARELAVAGAPIKYFAPSEGVMAIGGSMAMIKDAPNPDAAHAFINYMVTPEAQSAMSAAIGFGPVVEGAETPEDLKDYLVSPDDNIVDIDWEELAKHVEDWTLEYQRAVE